ncbi:MAG TPA: hypothetical protein VFQ80_04485, partial [Thermomicrobiales bacterium]|nr:hypothetical protein [Thermomicrobiales bacterium]
MDPKYFDGFVRSLGAAGNRRSALRLLAGTLAAVGMGAVASTEADQRHRRPRHKDERAPAAARHQPRHKHPCAPGLT